MEFDQRYIGALVGVFTSSGNASTADVFGTDVALDKNNVFSKFFVVNIASDEIEVPIFARSAIENAIINNLRYPLINNIKKVIISMYINGLPQSRGRADSIIMDFFKNVTFSDRLLKVITAKGEVYYGNKGLILDEDFNPLLMCSLMCKKLEYMGEQRMSYYKPVVHVGPQVLSDNNKLINKSILKKIIPLYISHSISPVCVPSYFVNNIPCNIKPQILISDMSKYIEEPVKPAPQKCSNEVLNQLLIDNIDEVLNQI